MKKSVLFLITVMFYICFLCSSCSFADEVSSFETALSNPNNSTYKIIENELINSWVGEFGNRQQAQKLTIKGNGYRISSPVENMITGIIVNQPNDSEEPLLKNQSLTISDLRISYFKNAIVNEGGNITLSVLTFNNNQSDTNGGAVNNKAGGTVTIKGSKYYNSYFYNNTAVNGGAVYNDGNLIIKDVVFGRRDYEFPYHIMDEHGNEYIVEDISDAVSLVYPYHYTVIVNKKPNTADYGGAVYNTGNANISSSTFMLNKANNDGGAIYNTSELSLSSDTFEENTSQNGGGIYINSDKKTDIIKSNFYKNSADVNGGAVYIENGDTKINKSYFGSQYKNGNSAVKGGAIYNSGLNTEIISSVFVQNNAQKGGDIYNTGTLNISKSTFGASQRETFYISGAISIWYLDRDKYITYANGTTEYIRPIIGEFKPVIEEEIYGSYANNGGAIYNNGNIYITSSKFTYAHAFEGGAIYNDSDGYLQIENSTFNKNYAKTRSDYEGDPQIHKGGVIYNNGGNALIKKSVFVGNYADNGFGGVIFNMASDEFKIENSTFKENKSAYGGVIYNNGKLKIENTTFILNTATDDENVDNDSAGGAIYNTNELTLIKSNIGKSNKKYAYTNTAVYGSGMFNSGTVNLQQSNVISNISTYGVIYNNTDGTLNIKNSNLKMNKSDYGGVLFTSTGSETNIEESNFISNTAQYAGGAIYNGGILNIDRLSVFKSNYSLTTSEAYISAGGIIFNDINGEINILGTKFNSNKSNAGGAIYSDGELNMDQIEYEYKKKKKTYSAYAKPTFTSNSVTDAGGAIYISKFADGKIKNSVFTKNKAYSTITESTTDESGITTTTTTAKGSGGAIFIGDTVNNDLTNTTLAEIQQTLIENSEFTSNTAGLMGGAIAVDDEAVVDIKNSKFEKNYAYYLKTVKTSQKVGKKIKTTTVKTYEGLGGAVSVSGQSSLTVSGSEFKKNYANKGGAVYVDNISTIIKNTKFTFNTAKGKKDNYGLGGAIFVNISKSATVNESSKFENNSADYGGAIYLSDEGTVNVDNSTFESNKASLNGGAVYTEKNGILNITQSEFKLNNSGDTGGAVYIGAYTAPEDPPEDYEPTYLNISASKFDSNSANVAGALYNANYLNLNDNEFTNNQGKQYSGAIHNAGVIKNKGGIFTNNKSVAYGGAILNAGTFIDGDYEEEEEVVPTKFTGNRVDYQGGAIYNAGDLSLNYTEFDSNISYLGGDICNNGNLVINNAKFKNTDEVVIYQGGAIYNTKAIVVTNSQFINKLASYTGGAIANMNGEMYYGSIQSENNLYSGNKSYYGGAIFNNSSSQSSLISQNDEFTSNMATLGGGAVYNVTKAVFKGTLLQGNGAVYGGAVYNMTNLVISDETIFEQNTSYYGGGVYSFSNTSTNNNNETVLNSKVTISNTTFTGNYAYYFGGGLSLSNTDTQISSSTFNENHADGDGGAIFVAKAEDILNLDSSTFNSNYVKRNGGAIYNEGTLNINILPDNSTETYTVTKFISNTADNGGAVYNMLKFKSDNTEFVSNTVNCHGGAIHNKGYAIISNGIFKSNKAFSEDLDNKGGAIYNNPLQTFIESEQGLNISDSAFGGNEADMGGAIYSVNYLNIENTYFGGTRVETHIEKSETGEFDEDENPIYEDVEVQENVEYAGNKAKKSGGAIYNKGYAVIKTSVFSGNTAADESNVNNKSAGGAIYNEHDLKIGEVTFDEDNAYHIESYNEENQKVIFTSNSSNNGGAVYNTQILYITNALFNDNTATSNGGAIYNSLHLRLSNVKFSGNNAKNGGAIYIDTPEVTSAKSIIAESKFINNTATSNGGAIHSAYKSNIVIKNCNFGEYDNEMGVVSNGNTANKGGAVYVANGGTATVLNSNFYGNNAEKGGAIYCGDACKFGIANSVFRGNSAEKGGAVYAASRSDVTIEDASFINNTATEKGGAIYIENGATVSLNAMNSDILFSGNTANDISNSIYMVTGSKLNLYADTNRTIEIADYIKVEPNVTISKGGDGDIIISGAMDLNNANVEINFGSLSARHESSLNGSNVYLSGNNTSLNIANNQTNTLSLGSLKVEDNTTSSLIIDMDLGSRKSDTVTANNLTGTGKLNVTKVNLLSNSIKPVEIEQADNSVITDITATRAETDEATYKLKTYLGANGRLRTLVYNQRAKACVLAAPIAAQIGGYLTQINSYDQAFMNMDMNMGVNKWERERNKSELNNKYAYTGYDQEYETNGINYNSKGLWTRPYATFERVGLNQGPRVSSISYGNFFGGDADLKEMRNGWARQFSAYIGYNGSVQDYFKQSIDQNGGTIGITEVWYKNNFFTGLTANVSGNMAQASTDLGHENMPMIMAGVASKTGYNWELGGKCKWIIIQPNLLISYSFVHTFSHKNGRGAHVGSSPLNAIQVAPGVKFIFNLPKGWQPYFNINMRWNIMDKAKFSLPDVAVPQMSVHPYVEYGIGVQRKWGERFTGFGQALVRNGGRNGVMLSFGFKWLIGK